MSRKYFGTDGVRGYVGNSVIQPEFVMKLGFAAGRILIRQETGHRPAVIIGKDTRVSGYMLEAALMAGFTAAGVDVHLTGPIPTPAIAYLTRALRLDAGVMISASHNPFHDNGIKFFAEGGVKLSDEIEAAIEQRIDEPFKTVAATEYGRAKRIDGATDRYIEFCKSTFPSEMSLYGLKIVVDCANGAAYNAAPAVFHELGAEVVPIGNTPNGFNINEKCGATYTKTLQAAVLQNDADYGIALDGDGDRLMMVDKNGRLYDGDSLIYVIAKARHVSGSLKGGVVGTVMTNMAMENCLKEQGILFERAKVGDRYVYENMKENDYVIGGEQSGHIIFRQHAHTGDGILTAIMLMNVMIKTQLPLSILAQNCEMYPQVLKNVVVDDKEATLEDSVVKEAVEKCGEALGDTGRVLLRASGTEPVLRVMSEAGTDKEAEEKVDLIIAAMAQSGHLKEVRK